MSSRKHGYLSGLKSAGDILWLHVCIASLIGIVYMFFVSAQDTVQAATKQKNYKQGLIPVLPEAFEKVTSEEKTENVVRALVSTKNYCMAFYVNENKELCANKLQVVIPDGLTHQQDVDLKRKNIIFDVPEGDPGYAKKTTYSHGEVSFEIHLHDHTEVSFIGE